MVFTAMATFVVGLAVVAAKTGARAGTGLPLVAASAPTVTVSQGGQGGNNGGTGKQEVAAPVGTWSARPSQALNARLTEALQAALGTRTAHLSVGVADLATGAEALFQRGERYEAGGITRADILAALLYQYQQSRPAMDSTDFGLAAEMIESGSRPATATATASLWKAIGQGDGLTAANQALGLTDTTPGPGSAWRRTGTTAADQLQLLADLAATRSVLNPASRACELGLMIRAAAVRPSDPAAAASLGASYAVNGGRQADLPGFVINRLSIIERAGHELLVVVLSRNWPTQAAGRSAVRAADAAAVSSMAGTL
ncbi:MAG TPA: hypothetical protein VMA72_02750 [Streptosporangiaceae bacterium]|nr:hypothetical protein [Streptosporangiaceae bacterium]